MEKTNYEKLLAGAAKLKDEPALTWDSIDKQAKFFKEAQAYLKTKKALDSFLKASTPFNAKYAAAIITASETQDSLKQKGITPYQALMCLICS
jgi:hypothetical protein